jgi:hypothetical protein
LNKVDLPTLGRPTMARVKLMISVIAGPGPDNPSKKSRKHLLDGCAG